MNTRDPLASIRTSSETFEQAMAEPRKLDLTRRDVETLMRLTEGAIVRLSGKPGEAHYRDLYRRMADQHMDCVAVRYSED